LNSDFIGNVNGVNYGDMNDIEMMGLGNFSSLINKNE